MEEKGIKVKDFIKELQKLDQERNIWVRYDGVYFYIPEVTEEGLISEFDVECNNFNGQELKVGDYTI